jgi:uncharacterized peroxidase-related enzyme
VVHHSAALTRESGNAALAEAVASLNLEQLPERLRAVARYAIKLTRTPHEMVERDLAPLRASGLADREIVDLNQVVAYFNYVNRVADGLGVELEARWAGPPGVTGS